MRVLGFSVTQPLVACGLLKREEFVEARKKKGINKGGVSWDLGVSEGAGNRCAAFGITCGQQLPGNERSWERKGEALEYSFLDIENVLIRPSFGFDGCYAIPFTKVHKCYLKPSFAI